MSLLSMIVTDTVDDSDNADNETWGYIARARDPARHGRFQEGLLKKYSARRLKPQANPTMKEFNSSRDFNHKSHNKRVKDGTGNASSVKLCESYPWGTRGCLSPASPAIDLFPRVPWDKRLLQAEERKKKQAKIKLITRKLAKRAGRFVFHKYNKSKDVLQLLQRLKFGH